MKEKIILIFITILSLLFRLNNLGTNPPSLDWDEASLGYNAYSLLKTGSDEYGTPHPLTLRSFGDYKPAAYIYFAAASIKVFGLNEFAIRFPSAFLGASLPIAFYLLLFIVGVYHGKSLHVKKIPIIGAFLFAVNPWAIQFSRGAFEANLGFSMFIWGMVILLLFQKKIWGLFLGSFIILSSVYAYHSNKFVAPIFFFTFLLLFLYKKKISLLKSTLLIIFSFIILLPFAISVERGYGLARLNSVSGGFDFQRVFAGLLNHFNFDFLFLNGDYNLRHHVIGFGQFFIFESIFIFFGVMWWTKKFKYRIIFVTLFLISLIPAAIASDTPHAIRSILSFPFFLTFIVYGFYEIHSKIQKTIVLLFYYSIVLVYSNALFKHYPAEAAESWQYGYKQMVQYLFYENNYEKYDKIIVTTAHDQPYVYMLLYSNGRFVNLKNKGDQNKGFDKFEFRKINFEEEKNKKNILIIGTTDEIKTNNVLKTIYFPDGKVAFNIAKGS